MSSSYETGGDQGVPRNPIDGEKSLQQKYDDAVRAARNQLKRAGSTYELTTVDLDRIADKVDGGEGILPRFGHKK